MKMNLKNNTYIAFFVERLQLQRRGIKLAIVVGADALFLSLAVLCSHMLRVSNFEFPQSSALPLYFLGPLLSITSASLFGVYGSISRTYTSDVEVRILASQTMVPIVWAVIVVVYGSYGFARSVVLIYFLLAVLVMITLRKMTSKFMTVPIRVGSNRERTPVIIYGAGSDGVALAQALKRQGRYMPVAFLDTDYTMTDRRVGGLRVYSTVDIDKVVLKYKPREVLVAKPRQNRASRRALVDMFVSHGLAVKTIPDVEELAGGNIDLTALRPIKLEDLLGRDPVPPDRNLMEKAVKGQVVLVTGAGGSIGSELVRQIAEYAPKCIIMLDSSEFSLFEIHREMELKFSRTNANQTKLVALLANITDKENVAGILHEHKVSVVLHAAAYKHVRMVQENALVGIRNNVWGTKIVAEAAIHAKVKLFILVSTDKAVRPTSIMGASKRVAEMVIQGLADAQTHKTIFTMVRFGNVLGSTGSVVPLFKEQIAKGGPVQVTHPDVTRFFMLIPEAAQLVIQAGAMARGGEVFVLDMGESVKIADLANTMIELAGLTRKTDSNPNGDIEIRFTGLRDGEKLFEELQIGHDIKSTSNPRIMKSNEHYLEWHKLLQKLKKVDAAINSKDLRLAVDNVFELAHSEKTEPGG